MGDMDEIGTELILKIEILCFVHYLLEKICLKNFFLKTTARALG